jgi:O-antigen ligase
MTMRTALDSLRSNAWFGGGPHAFQRTPGFQALQSRSAYTPLEPKNVFLSIGVSFGACGVFAYAALFGAIYKLTRGATNGDPWGRSLASIVGGLLFAGLFDVPFFSTNAALYPSTSVVLALASCLSLPQKALPLSRPARSGKAGA